MISYLYMDIIFNEEVVEGVFIIGTLAVLAITWFGYAKNKYSNKFSLSLISLFTIYMATFLSYRHSSGEIEEKVDTNQFYIAIAITHGIVSLLAVALTFYVFIQAGKSFARGENYFKDHRCLSLTLAVLWPVALISGFFLG